MKRKVIIIINIVLLLIIAFLAYRGNTQDMTGYAVFDRSKTIENQIITFNIKDLDTGEIFQSSDDEVFFASSDAKDFEKERLILIGSKNLFIDVDGDGMECSKNNYVIKSYYYDKNYNSKFDDEPMVYSSTTDKNGCVGAELPRDDYYIILGNYKENLIKNAEIFKDYEI